MGRSMLTRSGITQVDVLVGLFVFGLLAAGAIAVDNHAQERARQLRCMSNLRQIGQGMMIYANENRGAFPRTRFDKANADKAVAFTHPKAADPFGEGAPDANDVSAAFYLLVRAGDLTPGIFICPSTDDVAVGGDAKALSNFPEPKNLSYSYANPYVGKEGTAKKLKMNYTLPSDYAVAGDLNPGGAALKKATAEMLMAQGPDVAADPATGLAKVPANWKGVNSPNHGEWGQNVLFADGHVEWTMTPFCGKPREGKPDNIYTRHLSDEEAAKEGLELYMGSAMDASDSVLLPTAEVGKKKVKSSTPTERPVDPNANKTADPAGL